MGLDAKFLSALFCGRGGGGVREKMTLSKKVIFFVV
jgi:hypothetical protein